MKDYSIEYAHIYTNSQISLEHNSSLEILENLDQELSNATRSLVVMVDDYSFPDPTFDYEKFLSWLGARGHAPDIIFRESQLIPHCDKVLSLMPESDLKEQIISYIKTKKYPCSLFIAAWYLLRLGKITDNNFSTELMAKKLINILPESFKPFEDKAIEIIKETEFSDSVKSIENRYFLGRLIA